MPESIHGKKLISWTFPESTQYERSRRWYLLGIIVGGLMILYAVLTMNFLFALIIIVAAIILYLKASEDSKYIEFSVYEDGLIVNDKFYEFKAIKDFYLIYEPPEIKNLYFDFVSLLLPRLKIPLENINPVKVREILLDYLEEDLDHDEEPFSDWFERFFKL